MRRRAGQYRHTTLWKSKTRTTDGQGGYTETRALVTDGTRGAWISPVSSNERFDAQQLQEVVTHKVGTRYFAAATTAHVIEFGARIFDIVSVLNPFERNIETVALCLERQAA